MLLSPSRREFLRLIAAGAAYSGSALAQTTAAAFRSPYLQDLREDRATICWTSTSPGQGHVEFWDDARAVHQVPATLRQAGTRYRFDATLTGLSPASSYAYRASQDGVPVGTAKFATPGVPNFEFLAFGDSGTGSPAQQQLAQRMLQQPAAFVLHTGDLVYPAGSFERYESLYFAYYEELMRKAPFFPCPGNHDYYETSCIPYRALHSLPGESVPAQDQGRYYSFDWGNAHFISLDTNDSLLEAVRGTGGMLRWLEADLETSQKFWRIVVLHHSPYAAGQHESEIEGRLIREHITPILKKHAVPLVLNGHEHSYQRSVPVGGTTYITTGGGGAPLYPVPPSPLFEKAAAEFHFVSVSITGAKLNLRALRADGSVLDTWDLAPQPTVQSVVDAAAFGPDLASGGLATIFGHHLSGESTTVTANGQPLHILLASPGQLNVVLPEITGEVDLLIHGPNGWCSTKVTLAAAPSIFDGAILRADGSTVTEAAPAAPGETLSVYATGLGNGVVAIEWNGSEEPAHATAMPEFHGISMVTFTAPESAFESALVRVVTSGRRSNEIRVPGL